MTKETNNKNKQHRTAMPAQDPFSRKENFKEVALGYSPEMAVQEANRCLECKNPVCQTGCPVGVNIKDFIKEIKTGNFSEAQAIIQKTSTLPAICGRVCPQEKQCEAKCVLSKKGEPVAIGRLERFAGDQAMK